MLSADEWALTMIQKELAVDDQTSISFTEELNLLHQLLQKQYPFVKRIGVVLYEPETDELKTFSYSGCGQNVVQFYQFKLCESDSLSRAYHQNRPRIINDLERFGHNGRPHSTKIREAGFKASYTYPMFYHGQFYGFVFFNSTEKNVFTDDTVFDFELMSRLITVMVMNDLRLNALLQATLKSTLEIAGQKDPETREHLERVAHYSRLIAQEVAPKYDLDDEFVERVYLFAPLHDIGKIGIPDAILLKPGKLTHAEFDVMKSHVIKGYELIEKLLRHYELGALRHVDILKGIIRSHHESLDGSGYPDGLKDVEIPLEARIVAVADVFDALTSNRPYKSAWPNQVAFEELWAIADSKLDRDCVHALEKRREEVLKIQAMLEDSVA
ncbi:MAG: HD domain-containing protein [Hydrogenovibrio sp.]|nr:HD domain-containing protein [Hydrogenovibrio sp.]